MTQPVDWLLLLGLQRAPTTPVALQRPAKRRAQIVRWLDAVGAATARQVAEQFETDERTARRDMNALLAAKRVRISTRIYADDNRSGAAVYCIPRGASNA